MRSPHYCAAIPHRRIIPSISMPGFSESKKAVEDKLKKQISGQWIREYLADLKIRYKTSQESN
jgi:hypothetical protein